MILVNGNPIAKDTSSSTTEVGSGNELRSVVFNGSNIPYITTWYQGAPAIYFFDDNDDTSLKACSFCETYYGTTDGTDHWTLDSYESHINQNAETAATLDVAPTTNALGETVKNYTLNYIDGKITIHPKRRVSLEATIPIEICMYGYAGDGDVVEPENYAITNYSDGNVQVIDIEVSADGWNVVDKDPTELLRGEMSMKLKDTQVTTGHNSPKNSRRWIIGYSEEEGEGVKLNIPMTCYIAGGNVNDKEENYIAHVTYTLAVTDEEGEADPVPTA